MGGGPTLGSFCGISLYDAVVLDLTYHLGNQPLIIPNMGELS